jgi:hypothetical protein
MIPKLRNLAQKALNLKEYNLLKYNWLDIAEYVFGRSEKGNNF